MLIRRSRAWGLALIASLGVAAPLLVATAGSAGGTPAAEPAHGGLLEADLSGNGSNTTMGEPEIAVNPVDSRNLFIDWTTFPVPLVFGGPSPVAHPCGGLASRNGGLSWQPATVPLSSCADAVAAFGPDGTLYAGGIVVTSVTGRFTIHGYDAVLRSTDSGQTWSAPVKTMGSTSVAAFPFAPGSGTPLDTFDRPWIAVDQSTGTVYAAGHNLIDHEGFVTASTDEGQSFGTIYAIDSPGYPNDPNGRSSNIAATHGVLAVAYTAAKAPGASCPCVIFETSTDHGATFTRHIVPLANAATAPEPFLAADPHGNGRYALTVLDSSGTENQVYVTDDFGKTWRGPTLVAETPANQRFKPWITYGPSGQIALVWRTRYSDGSYDVWSAVGRDEGHKGALFSAPVRVSSVAAPYPPQYGGGDDFSWIIADHKYLHVGWGDSRDVPVDGGVQVWYARIPLTTFEGEQE